MRPDEIRSSCQLHEVLRNRSNRPLSGARWKLVERNGQRIVTGSVTLAVIDRDGKLQRIPDDLQKPLTSRH